MRRASVAPTFTRAWPRSLVLILVISLALSACGTPASSGRDDAIELPPTSGVFDYQLGGAYDAVPDGAPISVVARDHTESPLDGAYNICYVNGFQTQPDAAADWRSCPDLLLSTAEGEFVTDPDWPDEYVLDPSTQEQRTGILEHIGPMIQGCSDAGFDAVEIDNLDTWLRFPDIDEAGAQELAADYVSLAHGLGLAIVQKNAAEVAEFAHGDLGFDFAITEECGAWQECAAYTDVYGSAVLQIEYPDSLAASNMTFAEVCALSDRAPLTILRDRGLVSATQPEYRYEAC